MRMMKLTGAVVALLSTTSIVHADGHAAGVEVLHWWTSGGEAAALNVLKTDLEGQGVGWTDMPVAGGGGSDAMTVLRARVTAGDPPTAVQMLGFAIQDWAAEGALADLNALAAEQGWDDVVPAALQGFSKFDGSWVSAPVNVHSTNWVWANTAGAWTTWALPSPLHLGGIRRGDAKAAPGRGATSPWPMAVRPGRRRPSSTGVAMGVPAVADFYQIRLHRP